MLRFVAGAAQLVAPAVTVITELNPPCPSQARTVMRCEPEGTVSFLLMVSFGVEKASELSTYTFIPVIGPPEVVLARRCRVLPVTVVGAQILTVRNVGLAGQLATLVRFRNTSVM